MDALRRAAAEVLAELGEEPMQADGAIERISLDVQLGRQTEGHARRAVGTGLSLEDPQHPVHHVDQRR